MIVFGLREFLRAADSRIEFEEVFVDQNITQEDLGLIQSKIGDTSLLQLDHELFSKLMFGDRDETVIGVACRPATDLAKIELSKTNFVLVLQSIEKPGNLGAILRSADACGVTAVLLADIETDFFHPNSIRASTGAVFNVPIAHGTSNEIQSWMEQNEFRVMTAIVEGSGELFQADFHGNVAVALGNEANGLDEQWRRENYHPIRLPMLGMADSLNVSVTASVIMYEALRQRTSS